MVVFGRKIITKSGLKIFFIRGFDDVFGRKIIKKSVAKSP